MLSYLRRHITRFRYNQRGNVAVIFAIATIPLLAAVGCAVDYSIAAWMKAKLQSAADAASVASVSPNSAGWKAAVTMLSDGPVPAGSDEANNIFSGNMSPVGGYTDLSVRSTVTKHGPKLTSNVGFSAKVPVTFMSVLGYDKLTLTGSSKSTSSMPLYLDFYLMLDVSGSMGLPSTSNEQARLSAVNPDNFRQYPTGCTFACHFTPQSSACTDTGTQAYPTNNHCLGYAISRVSQSGYKGLLSTITKNSTYPAGKKLPSSIVSSLPNSLYSSLPTVSNCPSEGTDACIQLRLDAVGYAVNELFMTANNTKTMDNQFRIGLYPFIQHLYSYFPLTSNINGSSTSSGTINYAAANLASLLDTNTNMNLGSGGTHIDNAFSSMNALITGVGDGSTSSNTLPYVFLITDGAQDNQIKGVPNGGWSGSNHATVINPATVCKPLKDRGIIISVLYIPYQPISPVNASFAGDEDDYANWNIPNIPPSLQGCASPGFFYTANSPADITAALNAMFNHALIKAHITN